MTIITRHPAKEKLTRSPTFNSHNLCPKAAIRASRAKSLERPSAPVARTNPYEAPYFFPAPGSPEAVGYVDRAREDLKIDPVIAAAKNSARRGHSRANSRDSQFSHEILGGEQNVVVGTPPEGRRKRLLGDDSAQAVGIRAEEKPKSKFKKLGKGH